MRKINHYSQSKFSSLSPVHQLKALDNLVSSLSQSLSPNKNYFELKEHIIHCISWMQSPLPECVSQLSQDLQQEESFDKIYNALVQYQRARGKTFKDYQIQVRKGDGLKVVDAEAQRKAQQIILILDNLRSAFNIGSIFRTAECLNLQAIYLCGVCATPESAALKKTAMGTEDKVQWKYFPQTETAILSAKSEGYYIYALETAAKAKSIYEVNYQFPLAIVVGNESLGISQDALKLCDSFLAIPVQGWKNSLNVAVACAICVYQIVWGNLPQK